MQACSRDRTPIPERIANAPELVCGLELYYNAFLDLTSCRGYGYGTEGPISWMMIAEYADRDGFEGEQREDLFYFVQRLDAVYLDFKAKKLGAALKPPTKSTRRKVR